MYGSSGERTRKNWTTRWCRWTHQVVKRWLRMIMLLGVVYLVAGIVFGALAGWSASNQMRITWRLIRLKPEEARRAAMETSVSVRRRLDDAKTQSSDGE